MFGSIARRYDFLNHLLSFHLDRYWRRRAVAALNPASRDRVLDLCAGTGDLTALAASRTLQGFVVCCDFAHPMLQLARRKLSRRGIAARCLLLEADALHLPFPDASFDGVLVGFGVRNLADLEAGLRETARVLRPGGKLVVLEFSRPEGRFLSPLYRAYLRWVLPRLGDRIARARGPYGYLARTIASFPEPAHLAGLIREAGYAAVGWAPLSGGIVALHTAFKAPEPPG